MKKKIHFIDCGAHIGESATWALNQYGDNLHHIHSFEPQKENWIEFALNHKGNKKVTLIPQACWIKNETRPFFPQVDGARTGSSLVRFKLCVPNFERGKWRFYFNPETGEESQAPTLDEKAEEMPPSSLSTAINPFYHVMTKCMNLSEWIHKNVSDDHHNILKLDLEGAEYVVIPHLLANNIQNKIDEWFVEFHGEKVSTYNPKIEEPFRSGILNWTDWQDGQAMH